MKKGYLMLTTILLFIGLFTSGYAKSEEPAVTTDPTESDKYGGTLLRGVKSGI